jgi:hypothetical protein
MRSQIFIAVIKSKYRSKINVEQEMRVAVSSLIPRFEKMCGDHQAPPLPPVTFEIFFYFSLVIIYS